MVEDPDRVRSMLRRFSTPPPHSEDASLETGVASLLKDYLTDTPGRKAEPTPVAAIEVVTAPSKETEWRRPHVTEPRGKQVVASRGADRSQPGRSGARSGLGVSGFRSDMGRGAWDDDEKTPTRYGTHQLSDDVGELRRTVSMMRQVVDALLRSDPGHASKVLALLARQCPEDPWVRRTRSRMEDLRRRR